MKYMFFDLPDEIQHQIYSFYNPYKELYDSVHKQIKSKFIYKSCMKQLRSYNLYNLNGEIITFNRDAIIGS
jgi:hypothetical protein